MPTTIVLFCRMKMAVEEATYIANPFVTKEKFEKVS